MGPMRRPVWADSRPSGYTLNTPLRNSFAMRETLHSLTLFLLFLCMHICCNYDEKNEYAYVEDFVMVSSYQS
jgi:hypothetical protein